ncbi:hypothetical protein COOONC_26580 [Cooperia oncophora]
MELLLGGYFVGVYRSFDNSVPARIIASETFPKSCLSNDGNMLCSPLLPDFKLTGYAGPFGSKEKATQFLNSWIGSEKHGYERVGRELSTKFNVKWAESWCFLDHFVDLRSDEGLTVLNGYLGHAALFPEQPRLLTPNDEDSLEDDDDEFQDAAESVDEIDENTVLNDSLASLSARLSSLTLHSPGDVVVEDNLR